MTYPAVPPNQPPHQPGGAPAVCVRHPDRPTGLSCTRCGRPSCVDCLREASVGYHCVDCVSAGRQEVHRPRTVAGAVGGRSVVVPVLIGINLLVHVVVVAQSSNLVSAESGGLFNLFALVPGLVAQGEWWRIVTSGFLHVGLLHLAVNMLALWMLGRDLESVLGSGRFLALYLISLLGGSAAAMIFYAPNQALAGASGAVFGLMGGLVVVLHRMRIPMSQAIGIIMVNIVISVVVPGISLVGHLGGLIVGAAATVALVHAPARNRTAVQVGALAVLTALLLIVMVGVAAAA